MVGSIGRGYIRANTPSKLFHLNPVLVRPLAVLSAFAVMLSAPAVFAQTTVTERQRSDVKRLIDAAMADSTGYARLATLTDRFGHRLSGSKSLEDAIDWIL